jgi:hypothetical protein
LSFAAFNPHLPTQVRIRRGTAVLRREPAARGPNKRDHPMTLGTILLIVLILLLIGAIPAWPHSRGWGYGPSGLLGVVFIILIIMLLTGRL